MNESPIIVVAGARPNFMKIAPLYKELHRRGAAIKLLHTGQHYDEQMNSVFFRDLGLPEPDINLGVGSASHAVQTANVMVSFEEICQRIRPSYIIVVGDVNSTVACAMVAAKLWIPCGHVEAGLRSRDRRMPEEINRLITDAISTELYTPSPDADENLLAEGISKERIVRVGNIMIDSLLENLDRSKQSDILKRCGIEIGSYAAMTLNRPSNVDEEGVFVKIIEAMERIGECLPIVFPIHPRTKKQAERFELGERLQSIPNMVLLEPQGYLDFLCLLSNSKFVLTDSGGLQEETTAMGVPCLTMRENTERPITVTEGTNKIVGTDPDLIVQSAMEIIQGGGKKGKVPELWDGRTSIRIVDHIESILGE